MSAMTIPPFPSQDLAKLVLGYLAEEQLMTAYDEFLQASPYLDALRNEYDRIFMTSLKLILAEYRAVKICVETCKPFALRKKLFQCANLLEVVKFLINHIDINKLQMQDVSANKNSFSSDKSSMISTLKPNACEVCNSLKLATCVCKTKCGEVHTTSMQPGSNIDLSVRESSIETTSLSDLPGNHVSSRKKHVKVLEKEGSMSHSNSSCESHDLSSKQNTCIFQNVSGCNTNSSAMCVALENNIKNPNVSAKVTDTLESRQKIQEFNDILKFVCNQNTQKSDSQQGNVDSKVSNAGTFKDFATGVTGGENRNIVPDSSTSESINVQVPLTKEASLNMNTSTKKTRRVTKTQYLLKVSGNDSLGQTKEVIDVATINDSILPRIRPNVDESKVKILSDVKLDNETINSNLKMPPVLKNATSTPLMKMQTIVINGTPVYRPTTQICNTNNFTKDEIMAMPTIIITPVSGPPPQMSLPAPPQMVAPQASNFVPVSGSGVPKSLGPLVIDVSSSISSSTLSFSTENANMSTQPQQNVRNVSSLVKTVDNANLDRPADPANIAKSVDTVISASVPKDNVIAASTETSTPQVIPPVRKSSSTPRRTSHVRVLDFTTPRRILHETINECGSNQDVATEIILTKSSNITIPNGDKIDDAKEKISIEENEKSCKENEKISVLKKKNWDSDLRALAVGSPISQPKSKRKSTRKKKSEYQLNKEKSDDKKTSTKKKTKSKLSKKNESSEELCDNMNSVRKIVDIPIKPTINIISRSDKNVAKQEAECNQNKSNNEEHDTPEVDRMALQNVIGARLNISDLLETPYKQALYDIQMETPKFLGPDLPDDPMSEVKIMNIPTPLFLNSSKGTQATPSSYSSRPTDYSSGGSYYKPDDQDYLPLPEHLGCSGTSSKETLSIVESPVKTDKETNKVENTSSRSSRPVRKCTKNVSYYNNSLLNNKTKEKTEEADKSEDEYLLSDSISSSSSEKKINKENISKTPKVNTPHRVKVKSEKAKKTSLKKYKSPIKKEVSKSFMKIRPRRSTPIKGHKTKRKVSESSQGNKSKNLTKKRTTSKERNIHHTPAVVVAPTKSRRKSSTPRKLHCTKTFNYESSGHDSPDITSKDKQNPPQDSELLSTHDSDIEQMPLRWSDDGSQDAKSKEVQDGVVNDSEDISKIQEYIKTTVPNKTTADDNEGSLHKDLVKRGFDIETAKIIERDLLDTPPYSKQESSPNLKCIDIVEPKKEGVVEQTVELKNVANDLEIAKDDQLEDDDEGDDDVELSVYECNEDSKHYFNYHHDDNNVTPITETVKLKDKFSMEVCIDDSLSIRLRATPFNLLFEEEPQPSEDTIEYDQKEIEAAVSTIINVDKFQTPSKESIKAQCFEIFDSTLTSLDTPLKANNPKDKGAEVESEVTITEIILEVEQVDVKEKSDCKKRKRFLSGNNSDEPASESKKARPEAQYLFNSANIQNIDIESVLSKLHGP